MEQNRGELKAAATSAVIPAGLPSTMSSTIFKTLNQLQDNFGENRV